MPKITSNGKSRIFGGIRTPNNASSTTQMRTNLKPPIGANTMRPEIKTSAAKIRSPQTAGKVVKPW